MITRRTVTRGVAWTVPVIAAAAAAPAFAASAPVCNPTAECKLPGEGENTKDYAIRTNCVTGGAILAVDAFDDNSQTWRIGAYDEAADAWVVPEFNDSRRTRTVRITTEGGVTISALHFPPC